MILIQAVNIFFQVVIYMILARAICSWFVHPGDKLYPIYMKLCRVTDPILAPFQKFTFRISRTSALDLSALLALVALWVLNGLIVKLLAMLLG